MEKFRRTDRNARAVLSVAEAALTRAASSLFRGEALTAARSARLVEHLLTLSARMNEIETMRDQAACEIRAEKAAARAKRDELTLTEMRLQKYEDKIRSWARHLCESCEKHEHYVPDDIVWLAQGADGPLPAKVAASVSGDTPK